MNKIKSLLCNQGLLTFTACAALLATSHLLHAAGKMQGPCAQIEKTCTDFSPGKSKKDGELWKDCIRSVMSSDDEKAVHNSKFPRVPPAQIAECRQLRPNFGKAEKSVLQGGGQHE